MRASAQPASVVLDGGRSQQPPTTKPPPKAAAAYSSVRSKVATCSNRSPDPVPEGEGSGLDTEARLGVGGVERLGATVGWWLDTAVGPAGDGVDALVQPATSSPATRIPAARFKSLLRCPDRMGRRPIPGM